MSVVVIDAATREKFLAANGEMVEVRDEAGEVIGRFIRQQSQREEDYEILGEPASEEEIERRRRESPRYTAAQVEERLRRLRKCE
jgi:hypothetical protein